MRSVLATGNFDDFGSRDVRFFEAAARLGQVHVALWTDHLVQARERRPPKMPFDERRYLLEAVRHIASVFGVDEFPPEDLTGDTPGGESLIWVADERGLGSEIKASCDRRGVPFQALDPTKPESFAPPPPLRVEKSSGRPRVVVTGCYDWLHSGHVRFFEEASAYGDLYVGVGSDASLRTLKGPVHPLFPEAERTYMVQAIRHVTRAFIASGRGRMDAEPEIGVIEPRFYVVNEDGDHPEKREFCRRARIEYVVLSRRPKPGLPARDSTALRGF